jgi:hypothetical protein
VNTILDVHRSVREFIAKGLGAPPWRVRLSDEIPLTDKERPVAYVELLTPARTLEARASAPQGAIQRMAPFTVSAYPVMGGTPQLSRQEANVIADLLDKMLDAGVAVAKAPAQPSHIPIFDWADIPLDGATAAERRLPPTAEPYTWGLVPLGAGVQTIKDPMDPKRFTVGLTFTLRWWAPGSEGVIGGVSEGVDGAFVVPS